MPQSEINLSAARWNAHSAVSSPGRDPQDGDPVSTADGPAKTGRALGRPSADSQGRVPRVLCGNVTKLMPVP